MAPPFEQTRIVYNQGLFVCYIEDFISFGEEDFQRLAFKNLLCSNCLWLLNIISPIMPVAPPFEQTLIRHTQGLFVCNI